MPSEEESAIFQALTKAEQKGELEREIEHLEYTCGSTSADIECDDDSVLRSVFVQANLTCNTPTEILYYTDGNTPICYYCGSENELEEWQNFLICLPCVSKGNKPVVRRS